MLIFLFLVVQPGLADEADQQEPVPHVSLWEAGIAGGGGYISDYPAAGQNHWHGIALPYITYRGKYLRAGDGKGIVRGRYQPDSRVEFDLSLSGAFPTDSDDNDARRGMDDLDYLVSFGPRVQITLVQFPQKSKIDLEIPLRAVYSTDFSDIRYRGFVFHPEIAFQKRDFLGRGLQFKLSAGPIWATSEFMDYLYDVQPQYTTPQRPYYSSHSGYLGSQLKMAFLKKMTGRLKIFGALSIGYYGGAENRQSPLHQEDLNVGIGCGFMYSFWQSAEAGMDHTTEGLLDTP